jgi:hypothetical protein
VLHHLSGIVLRKTYLGCADTGQLAEIEQFWATFAREMIQGALDLVSVFDEFAATRSLTLGMPPILVSFASLASLPHLASPSRFCLSPLVSRLSTVAS